MIILSAMLKAKYGREKDLEKALKSMIPKVQAETGTLEYTIHQSQNNNGLYFLYESYKDKKSFDYHMSTPYLKQLLQQFDEILEDKPQIELFNIITSIKP